MIPPARPLAALAVLLASACAFQPGAGFATVAGGLITTPRVLDAARLDEQGRWKTDNGYRLKLDGDRLGIGLREVALQAPGKAAGGAGAGVVFDPAKPPPGYTLCHGNDCHREDGSIATFDEVRAELAGGGAATPPRTVLALTPAAPTLDLPLAGGSWRLEGCTPHCHLPQGALSRAVVSLTRLAASGTVAPASGGEARAWRLDLPLEGTTLASEIQADVGPTGPAAFELSGSLTVSAKLFDGLPWERLLAGAGPVELGADAQAAEALASNLAKSTFAGKLAPRP